MHYQQLALSSLLWALGSAVPTTLEKMEMLEVMLEPRQVSFPFTRIIAFGDDFTDNGQGSYAHGITGNETSGAGAHLWGANTWTDGPVAITDMSKDLGIPIAYDYAFGSSQGGAQIGAVCSNGLLATNHLSGHAHLLNGAVVPSAVQQVANYTMTGAFNQSISETLHFFWTGNNDMIASLGWLGRFTLCDTDTLCLKGQQTFITQLLGCFNSTLTSLLTSGAKHIMVPNVYPRHFAPWTGLYITSDPGMVANFGNVISQFNSQLQNLTQSLSTTYNAKVMYYDVNTFMTQALQTSSMISGAAYNFTCVDGCTQNVPGNVSNWNLYWNATIVHKGPDLFAWMTTVMPSRSFMQAIGIDMANFITQQYS